MEFAEQRYSANKNAGVLVGMFQNNGYPLRITTAGVLPVSR